VRSYQQYCGLARGLDVIGDRWSLLIIRELALRDCRYTDIRDGLPGIASNLLAQRMRDLTAAGVAERFDAPPPIAAPLYRLTRHGRDLLPTLFALVRWAQPLMVGGPEPSDIERNRWIAFAARAFITEIPVDVAELTILLDQPSEPVRLGISNGILTVTLHAASESNEKLLDVVVRGPLWYQLGLLSGEISGTKPEGLLDIAGRRDAIRRFRKLLAAYRPGDRVRSGVLG